jgi:hypothetical protein
VNARFSWPNSSLSTSPGGIAAQFQFHEGALPATATVVNRSIYGQYPESVERRVVQRNGYGISLHHFAYIRCNRTHNLPQVEVRRDSGRQIQEQLQPACLVCSQDQPVRDN